MSSTSTLHSYRPPEFSSGTVTSWIPLITPYSIGEECSTIFRLWRGELYAWEPAYNAEVGGPRCVPWPVITWWNQEWPGRNTETIVSIGPLSCPEPFTLAATSPIDALRTQIACCPSGYHFIAWKSVDEPNQCSSVVGPGTELTAQVSVGDSSYTPTTITTNASTTVYGIQINGWIFAEETGEPGDSPACNTSSSSSCNGALDTGDKIGIGVGVGMGVIGLATLAAGLLMMRRARNTRRPAPKTHSPEVLTQGILQRQEISWGPTIAQGTRRDPDNAVGVTYGAQPSELPNRPGELESR